MSVGAVHDRAPFLESTKYARSQTAPTGNSPLLGQAPHEEGIALASDFMCKAPMGEESIFVKRHIAATTFRINFIPMLSFKLRIDSG
jgi:hypothetical protein